MVRRGTILGQMDLGMTEAAPGAVPEAKPEDVRALAGALTGRKKAVSAADLARVLGDGWNERKVRSVARAAAPGIVSYPGAPGYKLWEECTVDEISHAIEAFRSQARDMEKRAAIYHDAYHRRFRG